MHYLAVNENEPAGKPIALCKKTPIKVTLHKPDEDLDVYKKSGLHGLRHHKILRIANEAIDQGGVLSCEDLAFILTSSVVTIKRDMSSMRKNGVILPTRGWRHEMGRGQTHKTQILELYLSGYQFSTIERRTKHSETAIKRYIQDFAVTLRTADMNRDLRPVMHRYLGAEVGDNYLQATRGDSADGELVVHIQPQRWFSRDFGA